MNDSLIRIRFRDARLDEGYERDGYVVIRNLANDSTVKSMLSLFNKHYQAPSEKVVTWNSAALVNKQEKIEISNGLLNSLVPILNNYIISYLIHYAYFLTKPAEKTATNIPMHRDASAVDEKTHDYLIFWMPLIDLNKQNGCLYVVPGSNRLFSYELPFGVDWPYGYLEKHIEPYKIDLKLNAGDAVIFSGKTLHGSYPNLTEQPRPVVCCGMIDPATQLLYYYYDKVGNKVKAYNVDPDFFLQNDFSSPDSKLALHRSFDYQPTPLNNRDIITFYKSNRNLFKNKFSLLTRFKSNYFY